MDWLTFISAVVGATLAGGGISGLFYIGAIRKLKSAEAESAQTKAEGDEFHLKRERLQFADEQLLEKDKRYAELSAKYYEQTLLVRKLNEQAVEREQLIGQQKAEIAELKAERKMKLCERRGCAERLPQSGF